MRRWLELAQAQRVQVVVPDVLQPLEEEVEIAVDGEMSARQAVAASGGELHDQLGARSGSAPRPSVSSRRSHAATLPSGEPEGTSAASAASVSPIGLQALCCARVIALTAVLAAPTAYAFDCAVAKKPATAGAAGMCDINTGEFTPLKNNPGSEERTHGGFIALTDGEVTTSTFAQAPQGVLSPVRPDGSQNDCDGKGLDPLEQASAPSGPNRLSLTEEEPRLAGAPSGPQEEPDVLAYASRRCMTATASGLSSMSR